jgi:hypothetical protein
VPAIAANTNIIASLKRQMGRNVIAHDPSLDHVTRFAIAMFSVKACRNGDNGRAV